MRLADATAGLAIAVETPTPRSDTDHLSLQVDGGDAARRGHTLQIVLAPGWTIEIDRRAHPLLQVHFHAPSEHTNVMRRAMSDSKAHLDELARHDLHNTREPQLLGERKIE